MVKIMVKLLQTFDIVSFYSLIHKLFSSMTSKRKGENKMKARLIKNEEGLWLLLADGCRIRAGKKELSQMLLRFQFISDLYPDGSSNCYWNIEHSDMTMVPGTTIAFITDSLELVVKTITPFLIIFPS